MGGGITERDLEEALARVRDDLAALDGSSLLVTGGTGFFGRWLLSLLAHAQARLGLALVVTVPSRDPGRFAAAHPCLAALPFLRLVAGDVRDLAPDGMSFTHAVHAATDTNRAPEDDPEGLVATIVDGTRRVIETAERAGTRRLLYVSSGAVYGPQPSDLPRLPEDFGGACDPLDPRAAYGNAKRFAEHLCALATARGGVETVVARAFAFVGAGLPLDGHFAIGNFVRDALAGRTVTVSGDGTPLRSYLYAADLAAWLVALLVRGRAGAAYNVGSDTALTIAEVAGAVAGAIPGSGPVAITGRPDPAAPRRRYVPSIDRARTELGLDAWTPLDEAIRRTARAARVA